MEYSIISEIIEKCLNDKTIKTTAGLQTREFNYVENIIAGFIAAAKIKKIPDKSINIGSNKEISIKKLVKIMMSLTSNKKVKFTKPDVIRSYLLANNTLALHTLGWEPKIRIRQGLEEIIKKNI